MKLELDLTDEEMAVLCFLVNVDPEWGEPLKDIEDCYEVFSDPKKDPYDAMRTLQGKLKEHSKRLRAR